MMCRQSLVAFLIATILPTGSAIAQNRLSSRLELETPVRAAMERVQFSTTTERDFTTSDRAIEQPQPKGPSAVPKIFFSALGAMGGFFGGGWVGARLEPACNCDDPGLKGALIGAPIGAVVGGIAGWKLGGVAARK